MTRTRTLRRRRGPVGLALLAATGIGVGVTWYVAARPSGPTPSDARPPAPEKRQEPAPASKSEPESGSGSESESASKSESASVSSAPEGHGEDTDAPSSPAPQHGVRSERLVLEDEWGAGPLDGAWWPESPEASHAVPGLLEALPDELRVSRVALPMPDWSDDQPKTLRLDDDRTIHLSWFAGMPRHTARITFETGDAVTVLVLPTDTGAEAASSVLSQVGDHRSREDLLADAGVEL